MHIRHTKLLNIVHMKKRAAVSELADALGVSAVTVRKDLSILARMGLLRREHGYAALLQSDDIANHLSFNYETKLGIALRAAETVHSGETVMIESGSCCTLLANALAETLRRITIITNSAFVASYVRKAPGVRTVLLGGAYQNESQVTVGPMVRQCLEGFSVGKLFIGIDGMDGDGFRSNDPMRAEAIHMMAQRAKSVAVLTESMKFRRTGAVPLFPFPAVDAVFTDDDIPAEATRRLHTAGAHVYTVPAVRGEAADAPVDTNPG